MTAIATMETAAPIGQLPPLPNSDCTTLPIMMPLVPPTSVGVM
jgi:hypothetical protein